VCPDQPQTLPRGGAESLVEAYGAALSEARARTLRLVAPVSEDGLDRVHDPLMSPLAWDLGHVAAFEDLWLCQRAGGLQPLRPDLAEVYDAAETPRSARIEAPYLRRDDALEYMERVRERALSVLERADLSHRGDRLNAHGFVWDMVVQHEHQHNETMLQTLQLAEQGTYAPERRPLPSTPASDGPAAISVTPGPFAMGDPGEGFAYDNERPRHRVDLPAFDVDRTPVTNGAYRDFLEGGGYHRRELWAAEGWAWRESAGVERPLYWTADGRERRFERLDELDPQMPVMHVSWHEASAFARWRGARLPTEAEWEKAAVWDPATGQARRQPWGEGEPSDELANLDQLGFGPAPVEALPAGSSACGVLGMIGDCWEWTSSSFTGYPRFEAFPYREYSEVFFGTSYKVLRGASWATRPSIARATFRNWDLPERRQLFVGFRCAVDA
jgi:gamma-glutamyl hercynylcysteine S-oxide synthase